MKALLLSFAFFISSSLFAFEEFKVQDSGPESQIKLKGTQDWKPAKKGENYKVGSSGKTGTGILVVAFDEKNQFRLLPNTEVTIDLKTKSARFRKVNEINLSMKKGAVKIDEDLPKDYELKVQTPTAVCGAVGTEFSVQTEGNRNRFECESGIIFASSLEDSSFDAPEIKKGQSLQADLSPGLENSYAKLNVKGGKIPLKMGNNDKVLNDANGEIELAQEKTNGKTNVAFKIGKNHYVIQKGEIKDYSEDEKGETLIKDYLYAAAKEGDLKSELDQTTTDSEKDRLNRELRKAAEDATKKRKALFDYRREIRDTIRNSQNTTRSRPTSIPR